ncbi:MAG: DUF3105 domain-containing protein [Myxococcales bacterium]|nr:DUF3105 domain-containing protein [Myxococcales bacterium]
MPIAIAVTLLAAGCGSSPLPTEGDGAAAADQSIAQAMDQSVPDGTTVQDGAGTDADLSVPDGALPDAAQDLAVPDLGSVDAAIPDLAKPADAAGIDLAVPSDLAKSDIKPADLAGPDLWNCGGGYLNSDAGALHCPLMCSPAVEAVKEEGAFHIDYCDTAPHAHNPPTSGLHWPWHPEWGVFTGVPQREWWIHALEHGGVVLLYNCPPAIDGGVPDGGGMGAYPCPDMGVPKAPNGCPNEIAKLVAIFKARKPDHLGVVRIIVAPDPLLPKKFGAVAWNWSYVSDQFDEKAIQCFVDARYGNGPEDAP